MCGLFGSLKKYKSTVNVKHLEAVVRLLSHRGPGGNGAFVNNSIGFGHCRLSIFDVSVLGSQPMAAFGNHLVFDDAIYNYLELIEKTC